MRINSKRIKESTISNITFIPTNTYTYYKGENSCTSGGQSVISFIISKNSVGLKKYIKCLININAKDS
jgi:hypothetical protein